MIDIMQDSQQQALIKHRAWLTTLVWISDAECWLSTFTLTAMAIVPLLLGWQAGWPAAIALFANHLVLFLIVAAVVPRPWTTTALPLLLLSLANLALFAFTGAGGLPVIAIVYALATLIAAGIITPVWLKVTRRWRAIDTYETRDDFRWLVTQAPLLLRFLAHRALVDTPRGVS